MTGRRLVACSIVLAGLLLLREDGVTRAQGTPGAAQATPAAKKEKSGQGGAVFPRTGVLRAGSTPDTARVASSLRSALQIVPAVAETVLWTPVDQSRPLAVRVLDARGQPPRGMALAALPIPILFEITGRPEGSVGARLTAGMQQDTTRLIVLSDANGFAAATLVRGTGWGVYNVTASLPDEFAEPVPGGQLARSFTTFTQGTSFRLVNLQVEPGRVADGLDSAAVSVMALDHLGAPVANASLAVTPHGVHEDETFRAPLRSVGGGVYVGKVAADMAGPNEVIVTDLGSETGTSVLVPFQHRPPGSLRLTLDGRLQRAGSARTQRLSAIVLDNDAKPFDVGERLVQFTASAGSLVPQPPDTDAVAVHGVELTYDSLGTVQVVATDVGSGLADTVEVLFPAVSLAGAPRAVFHVPPPGTTARFAVPLSVYVPPEYQLDSLRATLQYDPARASLVTCGDGDPTDPYVPVVIGNSPGSITIAASAGNGPPGNGLFEIESCMFDCTDPDATTFSLGAVAMHGTATTGAGGASALANGTIALPAAPIEVAEVIQKKATKTLCFNIMYSPGCKDQKDWIDEAIATLQESLTEACCTIELTKSEAKEVKAVEGGTFQSKWVRGAGGGTDCILSTSTGKMIQNTQKERKPECMNIYLVYTMSSDNGGGLMGGAEVGEACKPNRLDGDGNLNKGRVLGNDGKPLKGKDGKALSDKEVASAFVLCRVDKKKFISTFVHEFGHMMGLPHSEETKDNKEDDGADNPMHEKDGKGTTFAPFQCEWMMKDPNGFLQDIVKK